MNISGLYFFFLYDIDISIPKKIIRYIKYILKKLICRIGQDISIWFGCDIISYIYGFTLIVEAKFLFFHCYSNDLILTIFHNNSRYL